MVRDGTSTGIPHDMPVRLGGPTVALLAWFREEGPEALARARWVFMCKDYIRYRLTGSRSRSHRYSGLDLMNVRDAALRPAVLDASGSPWSGRPSASQSAEICGRVTGRPRQTRDSRGTPVADGLFDIDRLRAGTGIDRPGPLCLIAGCGASTSTSPPPPCSRDLFMTSLYCIPGLLADVRMKRDFGEQPRMGRLRDDGGEAKDTRAQGDQFSQPVNAMVKPSPRIRRGVPAIPLWEQRRSEDIRGFHGPARLA